MKIINVTWVGPDRRSPDLGNLTAGRVLEQPAHVLASPNWTTTAAELAKLTVEDLDGIAYAAFGLELEDGLKKEDVVAAIEKLLTATRAKIPAAPQTKPSEEK